MSVSSFFDKITGLQRKRERQQVDQYSDVVAAVAVGTEPEPEEVDRILARANKSVDDLKADVQRYRNRMAMRALAEALPRYQQERDEIKRKLDQLDRDFEEAERLYEEQRFPLESQLGEANEAIRTATNAREELVTTCEDPSLLAEMERIESEIERLGESNRDLLSQAAYFEDKADTEAMLAEREVNTGDREHRREKLTSHSKQAESLRRRIAANEKSRADLLRKREQVEQRMREA